MSYSNPQFGRTAETDALRKEAGKVLKQLRVERGLTQRELAVAVGFDYYTMVAQLEAGRGRVPPDRYEAFAKAFGLPTAKFVQMMLQYYDPITYKHLFGG